MLAGKFRGTAPNSNAMRDRLVAQAIACAKRRYVRGVVKTRKRGRRCFEFDVLQIKERNREHAKHQRSRCVVTLAQAGMPVLL